MNEGELQDILELTGTVIYKAKYEQNFPLVSLIGNIKKVTGFNAVDFLDDPPFFTKRIHPGDLNGYLKDLAQLSDKDSIKTIYRFKNAGGNYIWISDTKAILKDTKRNSYCIVGSLLDITDLKESIPENQSSNKVIKGKPDLATIVTGVEPVNIESIIQEEADRLMSIADQKNIYLRILSAETELYGYLNSKIFRFVMHILLQNAVKSVLKGGVIITQKILHDGEVDWLELRIIDTGIGIKEEELNMIFEDRDILDISITKSEYRNGLSLVKKYINDMNGDISASSKFGEGTTFIMHLPTHIISRSNYNQSEQKSPNNIISDNTGNCKPNILMVEDEEATREIVKIFLRNIFNLDTVDNGINAINMLYKKRYELILMDLNLGSGMNGVDTLQQIRKISGYQDIPVIAVTAYLLRFDHQFLLSKGFTDYLKKPYDHNSLIEIINKNLQLVQQKNEFKLHEV